MMAYYSLRQKNHVTVKNLNVKRITVSATKLEFLAIQLAAVKIVLILKVPLVQTTKLKFLPAMHLNSNKIKKAV